MLKNRFGQRAGPAADIQPPLLWPSRKPPQELGGHDAAPAPHHSFIAPGEVRFACQFCPHELLPLGLKLDRPLDAAQRAGLVFKRILEYW